MPTSVKGKKFFNRAKVQWDNLYKDAMEDLKWEREQEKKKKAKAASKKMAEMHKLYDDVMMLGI